MKKYLLFFLLLAFATEGNAQDPQISQYFNFPVLINPSFAGGDSQFKAGFLKRKQWYAAANGAYDTDFFNLEFGAPHLSAALLFSQDRSAGNSLLPWQSGSGAGGFTTDRLSAVLTYYTPLFGDWELRTGIKASWHRESFNFDNDNLVYIDQINEKKFTSPFTGNMAASVGDLGFGASIYGRFFWIGASADHIQNALATRSFNKSILSEYGGRDFSRMNWSLHAGTKVRLSLPNDPHWFTAVLYKNQFPFEQMEATTGMTVRGLRFAFSYRGIWTTEELSGRDALVVNLGYDHLLGETSSVKFDLSYDHPVSSLQNRVGGTIELSAQFTFSSKSWRDNMERFTHFRLMECPDPRKRSQGKLRSRVKTVRHK